MTHFVKTISFRNAYKPLIVAIILAKATIAHTNITLLN